MASLGRHYPRERSRAIRVQDYTILSILPGKGIKTLQVSLQTTDTGRGAVGSLLTEIGASGDVPEARSGEAASLSRPKLIPSGTNEGLGAKGRSVYFEEEDD